MSEFLQRTEVTSQPPFVCEIELGMTTSMSMADAAVTVLSLPRRFGEIVSGVSGDDDWDRLVRVPQASGRSALGWTAHTTALLTALGTLISSLPLQARPSIDTESLNPPSTQARLGAISHVLAELKSASSRAGEAISARSYDEVDRDCVLNGDTMRAYDAINVVVTQCVTQLANASDALEAAGAPTTNPDETDDGDD